MIEEVCIDMSDQYPKGMRKYMGELHFGYLITVCDRAEKEYPTVCPVVGLKLP
jgi:arsenate reductase